MFTINQDNSIYLTRGDTANLIVEIVDADGEIVSIQPSDKIYFTMKRDINDVEPALQKIAENGSSMIAISPEDTKHLSTGKYVYDIQYVQQLGPLKNVYTIVVPTAFRLGEEVTLED